MRPEDDAVPDLGLADEADDLGHVRLGYRHRLERAEARNVRSTLTALILGVATDES